MSYFIFALALGLGFFAISFRKGNALLSVILSVVVFLLFGTLNYFAMPTLNLWGFDVFWIEITFVAFGAWLLSMQDDDLCFKGDNWNWFRFAPLGLIMIILVAGIGETCECFNASSYNRLLADVEEVADTTFQKDVHPIPVDRMINVNKEYAKNLASNRIEHVQGLGSKCEFGEPVIINLNGSFDITDAKRVKQTLSFNNEQVWLVPLEHAGYTKWRRFDTTPGYCLISATNQDQIWFVTEVNGERLDLRYLQSACFGDNIERYVRTSGYAGYGMTDYTMEIDDNGRPFWVISVFQPTIGFGGEDVSGVLTVDVQTGDLKEYSVEEAPEWIDRIQPDDIVFSQVRTWGEYKKGWWNAAWGKDGVNIPTPGMSMVYSEGKCYWYTGIQSAGGDKSTSGFMLIDTRTKKVKYYSVAGFNENMATDIVNDQSEWARMANFTANPPVLYNVHGVPTYYMTLTGDGTKISGYAFVSLENEQIFAAGSSVQKALADYQKAIQTSGQYKVNDGNTDSKVVETLTVREVTFENGTYFVLFEGVNGIEFTGSPDAYRELKWTKKGHKVKVSYRKSAALTVPFDSFENISFTL